MIDLNNLSANARSAAMRGGTAGWGEMGSASANVRYMEQLEKRRGRRRKCHCGCELPVTHRGMANGVCLMTGCELTVRRWVKA